MKTAIELAAALSARYLDTKQMLPDELAHESAAMILQQAEQIEQLEVERLRLAGEVSNRNIRALEGDKSAAAFNTLYDEFETLRIERDALIALSEQLKKERDDACVQSLQFGAENKEFKADAERYRWLTVNAYVGIAPHPKPHEVWCLRLPNPTGCTTLDAAIDAMEGKS